MCHDKNSFINIYQLKNPYEVVLGDGQALIAVGRGKVVIDMAFRNGESKSRTLYDILFV